MEDRFGFNRGTSFPRKESSRGQFIEPNDNPFRSSSLSNVSRPINKNVQTSTQFNHERTNEVSFSQNRRWGTETNMINLGNDHTSPNCEPRQFVPRLGVTRPQHSRMLNSMSPNFEMVRPRFPFDSPMPFPPESKGRQPQASSSCQSGSHMFPPPSNSSRPDQNSLEPYHEDAPNNYSIRHPVQQAFSSVQMNTTYSPVGPPPMSQPPVPHVGSNMACPPQNAQSENGFFQNNNTGVQSTKNHDQRTFSNKQSGQCQKDIDENWIASWLMRKLDKTSTRSKHLKIHDAQHLIESCMVLLASLTKQKKHLQSIIGSADAPTWQCEVMLVEETKTELSTHQKKLTDEAVDNLEVEILARTKKRERLKRKRKANYEEKVVKETSRELKHQTLDTWRRQITQKQLEDKQNKEIKASADVFLSEVRKKLSDVKKTIDLLHALQKLRKIRKGFAQEQGRYLSFAYDKDFEDKTGYLTKLMKKQQTLYLEEEKTLKVMLETDWVEALEKEKEDKKHSDMIKKKRERKKHQLMLFGKQDNPSEKHVMHAFYQYYTQARHNFEALIQIRQGWDMYLLPDSFPGSTRIPDGWVLPCEPSSDTWASAIKQ